MKPVLVRLGLPGRVFAQSVHFVVWAIIIAMATGCVANKQYSIEPRTAPTPGGKDYERLRDDFLLDPFLIEFDDQGELWDVPTWARTDENPAESKPSQFEVARDAIDLAKKTYDVTLIEYVHGWKHNASAEVSPNDPTNLEKFKEFLRVLNELDKKAGTGRRRIYIGVYIAWRGASWTTMRGTDSSDPIKIANQVPLNLSFWDRLDAADRVGRASVSHVMLSLAAHTKAKTDILNKSPGGHTSDNVVIIGHSMGGRIVERAVAQVIVGGLALNGPTMADNLKMVEQLRGEVAKLEKDAEMLNEESLKLDAQNSEIAKHQGEINKVNDNQLALNSWTEKWTAFWKRVRDFFTSKDDGSVARTTTLPVAEEYPNIAAKIDEVDHQIALLLTELQKTDQKKTAVGTAAQLSPATTDQKPSNSAPVTLEALQSYKTQLEKMKNEAQDLRELNVSRDEKIKSNALLIARLQQEKQALQQKRDEQQKRVTELKEKKALAQQKRYEANLLQDRESVRPADLVLLINPASDSLFSRQVSEALDDSSFNKIWKSLDEKGIPQGPWIVSISSPADWATGKVYGLGSRLGWSFRSYRTDHNRDQFKYFVTPAPHNASFRNLTLTRIETGEHKAVLAEVCEALRNNLSELVLLNTDGPGLVNWLDSHGMGSLQNAIVTPEGLYQLVPAQPGTEIGNIKHRWYWVITTDQHLIRGHNDIFETRTGALVAGLLRLTRTIESNTTKTASSDNVVSGAAPAPKSSMPPPVSPTENP